MIIFPRSLPACLLVPADRAQSPILQKTSNKIFLNSVGDIGIHIGIYQQAGCYLFCWILLVEQFNIIANVEKMDLNLKQKDGQPVVSWLPIVRVLWTLVLRKLAYGQDAQGLRRTLVAMEICLLRISLSTITLFGAERLHSGDRSANR